MSYDPLVTFETNLMDLEQHFKREKHSSLNISLLELSEIANILLSFTKQKAISHIQPDR